MGHGRGVLSRSFGFVVCGGRGPSVVFRVLLLANGRRKVSGEAQHFEENGMRYGRAAQVSLSGRVR